MEAPEKTGFFEEKPGVQSFSRIGMAVNLAVAAFVTVYIVLDGSANDGDHILLIFGLWTMMYGGKNAAKYFENLKPKEK